MISAGLAFAGPPDLAALLLADLFQGPVGAALADAATKIPRQRKRDDEAQEGKDDSGGAVHVAMQ